MMKRELYKLEGDKLVRLRRNCPKCGDGVYLAEHKDRHSCGQCGYTEFKGRKEPIRETPMKKEEIPTPTSPDTPSKEQKPEVTPEPTPIPEEPAQQEQTDEKKIEENTKEQPKPKEEQPTNDETTEGEKSKKPSETPSEQSQE